MSLVTGLFFLVILLNQQWSPPLRLQASHCSTFRTICDIPSIAVFCSESIECFPGTASKFFLKLLVTIPVAPIIIIIIIMSCPLSSWVNTIMSENPLHHSSSLSSPLHHHYHHHTLPTQLPPTGQWHGLLNNAYQQLNHIYWATLRYSVAACDVIRPTCITCELLTAFILWQEPTL